MYIIDGEVGYVGSNNQTLPASRIQRDPMSIPSQIRELGCEQV
ncbi:MAG: hypothetical protein IH793_11795 [Acidobacteria bacterium]|nr:hypothetical protein [Acidobacteriota bacterium]